ncbi:MAG TPA: hypothetical protein VKA05_09390 [Acidimicrobiales bacterium]|nr:hypothetical protein [Acidimicrobiales bacterium]
MSVSPAGPSLGPPQPVAEGALSASPEIVAAIAAAVEACWPRHRAGTGRAPGAPEYVWRMSGRWWSKPVALRRDRPWSDHGS